MKNITLVAIDFQGHNLTRYALERTLEQIDVKEILVISDREFMPGARHIIREPITDYKEYGRFMLKGACEHVTTDHALYIHWDGIAHNKSQWTNEFLKYDYIGAPWPWEPEGRNIGNGGFSLRSRKLLDACIDEKVYVSEERGAAEDAALGVDHRPYLESQYGIKFAPTGLARQFSFELGRYQPSFGFHGPWNIFHFLDDSAMDFFAENMNYAGWNIYKWHHVLAAVIRRQRMDLYEMMLGKLIEHSPELLSKVAQWLEGDAIQGRTELIID